MAQQRETPPQSSCRACPKVLTCDHKEMEAVGFLPIPEGGFNNPDVDIVAGVDVANGPDRTSNIIVHLAEKSIEIVDHKMMPEQPLFYSENCFGTANAISFRKNHLQIHDLKTGAIHAHMEQLLIYAALFCLEYQAKASDITIELPDLLALEMSAFIPIGSWRKEHRKL